MRTRWLCAVLVIAGCSSGSTTPSSGAPSTLIRSLFVSAKHPYTDSQVAVSGGERLAITATGTAEWRFDCTGKCKVGPGGIPFSTQRCKKLQNGEFGAFTAPGLACFSLIGKIGPRGAPFEVGSSLHYTAPANASGDLYLGFNDDLYTDNSGGFKATISR